MIQIEEIISNIEAPNHAVMAEAQKRLDSLVKPLGSLGKLEHLAVQIAGIKGNVISEVHKKCTIVMAADHGIVEEGVGCAPQEVTAIQTLNMLKGLTGINVISRSNHSDIRVVDIGIKVDISHPNFINKKIKYGTNNFANEPALTREEVFKALATGFEVVEALHHDGYDLLGTGEMGIGNTSCSSAILMAITGCSVEQAVGKGGGITDEVFDHKKKVIQNAITKHKLDSNDIIDILAKVGGLDIIGMTGCYLGAAYYKIPIVIDGFISATAALVAYKLNPITKAYMIPSHCSMEPGYMHVMKTIELEPMLQLNMRLGEGTGCPIVFNIIETALAVIAQMATFEEAMIDQNHLVDIR